MHLMALGMFLFQLDTLPFDDLQRRTDWQHARSPRVGARDATQFVGPGEERISLTGSAYALISGGRDSLDDLREMANDGEALPLLDGQGTVYGDFVILSIDERHAGMLPNGTPRRIDFAIELLRVDDSETTAARRLLRGDGTAVTVA